MSRNKFGLATKYGPFIVSYVTGSWIYAEVGEYAPFTYYDGKAHLNDDKPALEYQGKRYTGSIGFNVGRNEAGAPILVVNEQRVHLVRGFATDATPTAKRKIAEAALTALYAYYGANSEAFELALAQAEVEDCERTYGYVACEVRELQTRVVEAEEKLAAESSKRATAIAALNALSFATEPLVAK